VPYTLDYVEAVGGEHEQPPLESLDLIGKCPRLGTGTRSLCPPALCADSRPTFAAGFVVSERRALPRSGVPGHVVDTRL